jgi:hypothetical protein
MVEQITSTNKAVDVIAAATGRQENTRVLVALNQATDREPEVRALFNELANNFVAELIALLTKLGLEPTTANADLVHALFIGLSVMQLATGGPNGQARSEAALNVAFDLLGSQGLPDEKRLRRRNSILQLSGDIIGLGDTEESSQDTTRGRRSPLKLLQITFLSE